MVYCAEAEAVTPLPGGTDGLAVCAGAGGAVTVAVFDDRCPPLLPDAPRVEPPPPRPLDLCFWSSATCRWADCRVPRESSGLAVSAAAAAWSVSNNYVSEESGAGAFWGARLAAGVAAECLTPPDEGLPRLGVSLWSLYYSTFSRTV